MLSTPFNKGLGLSAPLPTHLNNGTLTSRMSEPQKDANSDATHEYSLSRQIYLQTPAPTSTLAVKKRWLPNTNRDASSTAARRRAIHVGQTSMVVTAATPHSYQTHDRSVNQQTISQAQNRCRKGGYCVPPKIAASPSNTTTFHIGLTGPLDRSQKSYVCVPSVLDRLRNTTRGPCMPLYETK